MTTTPSDAISQYEVKEEIGRGAFGCAYLVANKVTKEKCVMKKVRLARQSERQRMASHREMQLVQALRHPFIVDYKESWVERQHTICIINGYCEGGDLASLLRRTGGRKHVPENVLHEWLAQILLAVDYLHRNRVLHRDLKSSNIFLTAEGDIKIGDFGLAKVLADGELSQSVVGTPNYMCPELLNEEPYGYASDIWSLGCVLYELTALRPAFAAFNMEGLIAKIKKAVTAPLPSGYSPEWCSLVRCMLRRQPERRPTVGDMLAAPFLQAALAAQRERAQAMVAASPWLYEQQPELMTGHGLGSPEKDDPDTWRRARDRAAAAMPPPFPRGQDRLVPGGELESDTDDSLPAWRRGPPVSPPAPLGFPVRAVSAPPAPVAAPVSVLSPPQPAAPAPMRSPQSLVRGTPSAVSPTSAPPRRRPPPVVTASPVEDDHPAPPNAGGGVSSRRPAANGWMAKPAPSPPPPLVPPPPTGTAIVRRSTGATSGIPPPSGMRSSFPDRHMLGDPPPGPRVSAITGRPFRADDAQSPGANGHGEIRPVPPVGPPLHEMPSAAVTRLMQPRPGVPPPALHAAVGSLPLSPAVSPGGDGADRERLLLGATLQLCTQLYAAGRMQELGQLLEGLPRGAEGAALGADPSALFPPVGVLAIANVAGRGKFELGDRVVLGRQRKLEGTIRYYGPTAFATGEWVGIALDAPEGKHDGTVGGISYFRCPPACGLFVQATILRPGGDPSVPQVAAAPIFGSGTSPDRAVAASREPACDAGLPGMRQAWPADQIS